MTFDEWFEKEFVPSFAYSNHNPYRYESVARRAWDASREALEEDCPELAGDGSNYDF